MVWNAIFLDFARYWGFTRGIGPDSSSILPSPGACCWGMRRLLDFKQGLKIDPVVLDRDL